MKLTLPVPIEKISSSLGMSTFRHEPREVEVIAVLRYRADRHGRTWHYHAWFRHPDAHPEAPTASGVPGLHQQWIRRADHPRWTPPEFPDAKATTVHIGAPSGAQEDTQ